MQSKYYPPLAGSLLQVYACRIPVTRFCQELEGGDLQSKYYPPLAGSLLQVYACRIPVTRFCQELEGGDLQSKYYPPLDRFLSRLRACRVIRNALRYLEYNSTIKCSAIGVSISSRLGRVTTLPSSLSTSTVIQAGTVMDISLISLNFGEL